MKLLATLLSAIAVLAAFGAAAQERRVLPPDPQEGEAFAYVAGLPYGLFFSNFTTSIARREGGVIFITQPLLPFGGTNQWSRFGATIDGLPAGSYTIRTGPYQNLHAKPFEVPAIDATVSVSAGTPATPRYRDLDGNWFDPGQPGWGINLVQGESGALFAVYLGYGDVGQRGVFGYPAAWLVMPAGRWTSPTTFRGLIYESLGSALTEPARASEVAVVGMLTLELSAQDRMSFTMLRATNNGIWVEQAATLRRFAF